MEINENYIFSLLPLLLFYKIKGNVNPNKDSTVFEWRWKSDSQPFYSVHNGTKLSTNFDVNECGFKLFCTSRNNCFNKYILHKKALICSLLNCIWDNCISQMYHQRQNSHIFHDCHIFWYITSNLIHNPIFIYGQRNKVKRAC